LEGTLSFIALADDQAGMFDDLVIGIAGQVVGHQYKSSSKPKPVGVKGLLLGEENVIADCATSFTMLEAAFPGKFIRVRYITSHIASVADKGQFGVTGRDSADFFQEKARYPDRSLADWRAGIWQPLIDQLLKASGLTEANFERFFARFEIVLSAPPSAELNPALDVATRAQIVELAHTLGDLVGRNDGRTRWSRRELLDELGWPDRLQQRFEHRFPLGAHVQGNEKSEAELEKALTTHPSGYLCLLGPPGSGKSTLLERFVRPGPGRNVARYLAYVPGAAQGQGRGVDANFLADLNSQLIGLGFQSSRAKDDTLEQRRETFQKLLEQAAKRYATDGQLTIIVVDGLDHVPREEKPNASFLRALPLPQSVPEGIVFILGSQRIDLTDIPREVRDQASLDDRRIEIAPLTETAVGDMVASAGLAGTVDPADVFSVSLGHPLVTQYLLGKLLSADVEERQALLAGGFQYDGDLEKVYRAAWREAEEADGEISKVLFTLSFAEGRIEPELLAQCLTREAVNKAYKIAHHLIDHSSHGWLIFHNSFRLFLRQQTIELYGRPDPDFSGTALYRRLADLAKSAPRTSAQCWLEFRYRFLAGDQTEAAAIASRRYFIKQFIDGRRSHEAGNDIQDAFTCLRQDQSPTRLFDLMLAKDEISRRQDALNMSEHLVAAQIAAGDLDVAEAQLDSNHTAGDEWLVIKALLDNGQADRARAIFDSVNPWEWFNEGHRSGSEDSLEDWADYAVILLDDEQIERRIRKRDRKGDDDKQPSAGEAHKDYLGRLRFALARSILRRDPNRRVEEVAAQHEIESGERATLYLQGAEARLVASRSDAALTCLIDYEACCDAEALHGSWHVYAARLALAGGSLELAVRLFAKAHTPNLGNLEHRSEEVTEAVRYLVLYCATAAQLGEKPPRPDLPKEFLFRGIQNQAVRLGTMIGDLKAERSTELTAVSTEITASLKFLAGATPGRHDDILLGYRVRHAHEPLFDAICEIVRLAPDAAPVFAAEFEACLQLPVCTFRDHFAIHRKFTETMFDFDGDAASAVKRLEHARREVDGSRSPHEAIDRLSELAIAFGRIGFHARAREMLHEMREMSLGAHLAAKKDGQYHLWADLLVAAKRTDPSRAAERSFMMLQLVAGVDDSEAHDQAWRISKTVLVEAIACGAAPAWDAFDWAKASGIWHWDALIDAVARGMVRRRPDLAIPLAITWTALGLPYYSEVYNSVTRTGEFLRELVALTPADTLPEVERAIVASLERDAPPVERPTLLRIFRDALADRAVHSTVVSAAVERWNAEPAYDKDALPDYFLLETLEDVERAVASERKRREAQTSVYHGDFVNRLLAKRIGRIVAGETWSNVEAFAARNAELVRNKSVIEAVAKAAVSAGEREYAETLLFADDREHIGWGGWADRRLLEYHQGRHLIGADDAHERARNDFIRDLAAGGFGTGSALSGIEEIFPLLYRDIDWADLWDRLAEQVEGYRDFQKALAVPRDSSVAHDDIDLLARLFREAVNFGISDPHKLAADGLLELIRKGSVDLFCRACRPLIEGEGPEVQLGARLLFEGRHNDAVAAAFRDDMNRLAAHEDACVAALGEILSDVWGGEARMSEADLPSIYVLELPSLDTTANRTLRDEESLGPVIDDPAAWTEGFEQWVGGLSRYSGVPTANIRRRVAQLITNWGGAAKYGAKAAEQLQSNLAPLGLLLPFVRPHIGICLRALHVIVGELWRASRLSKMEVDLLLHQLTGGPVLPPRSIISARPLDITWPVLPEELWRSEAEHWLNAEDMRRHAPPHNVVGEWARLVIFESGSVYEEGMMVARGMANLDAEDVDDAIAALPKAYWGCGRTMVGSELKVVTVALRNLCISRVGDRAEALIFDPLLARRLGWYPSPDDPFSFCDAGSRLMATTRFWRDGWQQQTRHASAFRWAEGQRVELTEAGQADIERRGGLPTPVTARWRVLERRQPKPKLASKWRSDEQLPTAPERED
jgi:hypothetical protein